MGRHKHYLFRCDQDANASGISVFHQWYLSLNEPAVRFVHCVETSGACLRHDYAWSLFNGLTDCGSCFNSQEQIFNDKLQIGWVSIKAHEIGSICRAYGFQLEWNFCFIPYLYARPKWSACYECVSKMDMLLGESNREHYKKKVLEYWPKVLICRNWPPATEFSVRPCAIRVLRNQSKVPQHYLPELHSMF